ncbi:MAG: aspartate kinase [Bacteroidota bacterium]|nr:aspartate kinase [Bacteroidota bacterium]
MKVFKFGGASVNNVERIQNMASILQSYQQEPLVVIISAMGKTTNALEKVAESFFNGRKEEALQLFDIVKKQHLTTAKYLLVTHFNACLSQLTDFFTEVEWLLHDKPVREYDYYYDQIVCVGELLSTCIISHYLNEVKIKNEWMDVRDILKTDNRFRNANVYWEESSIKVKEAVSTPSLLHITQGFIGCTDENESTTLGREGSDYTAAIFANILDAESLTIWKDVEGVMNADPKQFPEAVVMNELSFEEVIEMAYYGAQVIHPKTIKPLQNKSIPLQVKCFLDPSLSGTTISNKKIKQLPPVIVVKEKQVLMHLRTQDFSFVGEQHISHLYETLSRIGLQPNLVQTGAISIQLCLDDKVEQIDKLAAIAGFTFDVQVEKELVLLTIRHYTKAIQEEKIVGKDVLLLQQTKETLQALFRS